MSTTTTETFTLLQAEGVLFDFNGTLSDDEGILRELFIALAEKECGVVLSAAQYHADLAGRSDTEILEEIAALAGDACLFEAMLERLQPIIDVEYKARVAAENPVLPATRELVRALHAAGVKLGVVTGASRLQVIPVLEDAGLLALFGVVVTDEDVEQGKPHPEGFLKAARALGLTDSSRVVAFEDSIPGLGAVAAAGMKAICVAGTHPTIILEQHARTIVPAISTDCLGLELN